ncbi:hypothetical protein [Streptomyces niveus]|uniref:hypothetical protein n=1 Tax=Streptomyces niveus TaxID=193462 RepID=UPI0003C620DF|nr:hypothetical protein [Streptomyces niveus]EST25148.1 hypothetical protein M877_23080 [Streptomyces niveus NCIMB 11891]
MTAAMVEDDSSSKFCPWEYLLETWRELDVPEGWRAEIDEARIFLVPPPHAHHNGLVPIYLFIDRFDTRGPVVTLFTEPSEDGTYKHSEQVPFGKPITLPEPFRTTLETAAFPV